MRPAKKVFISYARQDDLSLFDGEPGWVSTFHRALEVYLGQLLGKNRKPKIWRDPLLDGNEVLENALLEQLSDVAALVCIVSPSYVDSDWCIWELQQFWQTCYGTTSIKNLTQIPIFKVVMIPVPRAKYPPQFQPLLGYEFYKIDSMDGRFQLLDPSIDPSMKRDYWAKLNDLAQGLRDLFERLEEEGQEEESPTKVRASEPEGVAKPAADRPAVYLAETSSDLTSQREEVRRDLLRHGYVVFPEGNLPRVASDLEATVGQQLAECRLSVHLIGQTYGLVPDGTTESIVSMQNRLALERVGGALDRLIWMPRGLETDDARQQGFLDSLWSQAGSQRSGDLLETSLEDLKTVIHQQLEAANQPKVASPEPPPGERRRVYLICDERDLDQTELIEDYLYDRGLEVVLPLFEAEDEKELRLEHERNLASCDGILIFWGQGSEAWFRRKRRELERSRGYDHRTRPLRMQGIFLAEPASPRKQRLEAADSLIIRAEQGAAALAPFVGGLSDAGVTH